MQGDEGHAGNKTPMASETKILHRTAWHRNARNLQPDAS